VIRPTLMTDPIGFSLSAGLDLAGAEISEVWWRYVANGGLGDPALLAARIAGTAPCERIEHDLIAQALNECFLDRGLSTFPVSYHPKKPPVASVAARLPVPSVTVRTPASYEVRRRSAQARQRSAEAARQASELQLTAARLMKESGQLLFARRAASRGVAAYARGACAAVSC